MSNNESMKDKLVNSMKLTKSGTATTTTAGEQKSKTEQQSATPAKKAAQPRKKAAPKTLKKDAATPVVSGFSSGRRVWPD